MANEYIIVTKDSVQISPDDWDIITRVFKATDETTLKEIRDWYVQFRKGETVVTNGKVSTDKSKVKLEGLQIAQL